MVEYAYSPLYLRGIDEFNRRRFFAGHQAWEKLWLAETGVSKAFYKGLIQAAMSLHHLSNGNNQGAKKLFAGARRYLAPYRPKHLGLDVDRFLAEVARCVVPGSSGVEAPERTAMDPGCVPRICLDPPRQTRARVTYP